MFAALFMGCAGIVFCLLSWIVLTIISRDPDHMHKPRYRRDSQLVGHGLWVLGLAIIFLAFQMH